MSELIVQTNNRQMIRWKLLMGASGLALGSYLASVAAARASDKDQPTIWIEVDGQFANQSVGSDSFVPAFAEASPFGAGAELARKRPPSGWDEGGKITFEPADSDWLLSLGVRYGKSSRSKARNQYTKQTGGYFSKYYTALQSVKAASSEKHLILDFQAGKDIGLGMFGQHGKSTVSLGIRYAQFSSRNNVTLRSITAAVPTSYYIFHAGFDAKRDFNGIGPSLSWDASADLVGNHNDGSLTLDWGVNGALLFGRQKVKIHHHKTGQYQEETAKYYPSLRTTTYHTSASPERSQSVTVPNLGGYAALSLRYSRVKMSLGYRVDYFFNAIDGGIDAHKSYDRGFYGPFASFSIGLGG
ncbi:MAG TPA: hypothetical protein VMS78_15490 [Rhizomicrobium sp.]|nr:hypothetical protein [Rhizomicrobium sp.]